jgi:hypothetical protein
MRKEDSMTQDTESEYLDSALLGLFHGRHHLPEDTGRSAQRSILRLMNVC